MKTHEEMEIEWTRAYRRTDNDPRAVVDYFLGLAARGEIPILKEMAMYDVFKAGDRVRCVRKGGQARPYNIGDEFVVLAARDRPYISINGSSTDFWSIGDHRSLDFELISQLTTVDLSKPVQYRNGEAARVLCTDAPGDYPVISLGDDGCVLHHYADGTRGGDNLYDLINVPEPPREPREIWVNEYPGSQGVSWSLPCKTRARADELADETRTACVRFREVLE